MKTLSVAEQFIPIYIWTIYKSTEQNFSLGRLLGFHFETAAKLNTSGKRKCDIGICNKLTVFSGKSNRILTKRCTMEYTSQACWVSGIIICTTLGKAAKETHFDACHKRICKMRLYLRIDVVYTWMYRKEMSLDAALCFESDTF